MTTGIKRFIVLGFIWFAAMASMVVTAPLSEHPLLFSVLFGLGSILMILMVRWFPTDIDPRKALVAIFILGVAGRLVFIPYPVGGRYIPLRLGRLYSNPGL